MWNWSSIMSHQKKTELHINTHIECKYTNIYATNIIYTCGSLTSVALVFVSSSVDTSSTLSNMFPWDEASSRSSESSKSFRSRLLSLGKEDKINEKNLLNKKYNTLIFIYI